MVIALPPILLNGDVHGPQNHYAGGYAWEPRSPCWKWCGEGMPLRTATREVQGRGQILHALPILQRPAEDADCAVPRHRVGDPIARRYPRAP